MRPVVAPRTLAGAVADRLADDAWRMRRQERRSVPDKSLRQPFSSLTPGDYGIYHVDDTRWDSQSALVLADGSAADVTLSVTYWLGGVQQAFPISVAAGQTLLVRYEDVTSTGELPCFTLAGYDLKPDSFESTEVPAFEEDTE